MPSDPERLKVVERVVTVLSAITAGSTYFYTPYKVEKFRKVREQVSLPEHKPHYSVLSDVGDVEFAGADISDEQMTISVFGMVESSTDLVGTVEKSREDVINAISADINDGGAGTLITLAAWPDVPLSPRIHYEPGKNWAIFRQDFKCQVIINF